MPEHAHVLAWGHQTVRDAGPNGDEPRHVRAGQTWRPSSDDLCNYPDKFIPILESKSGPQTN
jgi:hypothetical protein